MVLTHQSAASSPATGGGVRLVWAFAVLGGLAQSLAGAAGGLLAREVGGSELAAGMPQTMLVVGAAGAALLLARVAARRGRALSLGLGCLIATAGCSTVVAGGLGGSLEVVLLGNLLVGAGVAAVMLARYAAAELQPSWTRARSIASVLSATTLGAVVGPNLLAPSTAVTRSVDGPALVGPYALAAVAFLAATLTIGRARGVLRAPGRPSPRPDPAAIGPVTADLATGVSVLVVANLVMVAVMTMAPIHLRHGGAGLGVIGLVVSVHIAGMFAPSPLSGRLAEALGPRRAALVSLAVLTAACASAASAGMDPTRLGAAMLLLGVGWNVALVAGSDLLTRGVAPESLPRREGLGEVGMGLAAAVGGAGSGIVVDLLGYPGLAVIAGALTAVLLLGLTGWPAGRRVIRSSAPAAETTR